MEKQDPFWSLKELFAVWRTEITFGFARAAAILLALSFVVTFGYLIFAAIDNQFSPSTILWLLPFLAMNYWIVSLIVAETRLISRMPTHEYLRWRKNPFSYTIAKTEYPWK